MGSAAIGDGDDHHDFVGRGGVINAEGQRVKMRAHVHLIFVVQRHINDRARSAFLFADGIIARPPPTASRRGAPSVGCIKAAACSSSPSMPTMAALP